MYLIRLTVTLLEQIGEIAKSQQTTISVIGIQTGKDYNMETVSNAAAITGGTINLLNPHELSHKLREITQDTVVATNVTVTVLLHPNFSFVSEKVLCYNLYDWYQISKKKRCLFFFPSIYGK